VRPYHSASSAATGDRCPRAWALQYIDGIEEPRITWAHVAQGLPCTPRQRSAALGVETHDRLEKHFDRGGFDATDLPGQIAASGVHLIPHPERVHAHECESPIGDVAIVHDSPHAPKVALVVDGIAWVGPRDLVVSAPAEFARLKIDAPDGWLLVDYKTTAEIRAWAKTPDDLRADLQANLYTLGTCLELGIAELPLRWLYLETKRVRRAWPVDVTIGIGAAREVVEAASERMRVLDAIERSSDAPQNRAACGAYGGCRHHVSAGGTCDAQRSYGQLLQARTPEKRIEMDQATKDKFAAFKKGAATAPSTDAAEPAEAPAAEPPKRGRPRKAPAAEAAPESPEPSGDARSFTIDAAHGPLTITGDARDVLDAVSALNAAS